VSDYRSGEGQVPPSESSIDPGREVNDAGSKLEGMTKQIEAQEARIARIENRLPNTEILSRSYMRRALAIWGHVFVVGVIFTIVVYGGMTLLILVLGLLASILGQ